MILKIESETLSINSRLNFFNKNRIGKTVLTFCFMLLQINIATAQNESIYTSLDAKDCKTIEQSDEGAGWYRGECKGVGGYKLEVTEGDLRQSINVLSPSGKKFELGLQRVSSGFSSVGSKAEWRINKTKPIALIFRFNANENPKNPNHITSYLIVAKISKTATCIIDVVKPSKNQNIESQKRADEAQRPCKIFE